MRIHILQHVAFEDAGAIEKIAIEKAYPLSYTRFFEEFQLPEPNSFDLLIIMGGPMNINDEGKYPWLFEEKKFIKNCIKEKKKILGFCLGSQLLADAFGATVYRNKEKEIGWFPIEKHIDGNHQLLKFFSKKSYVFHWHGDTFSLPIGAIPLFSSKATPLQGFIMDDLWIGLQFHLETLPHSVKSLLKFAKNDLNPGGKYVQSPEDMLRGTVHIPEANKKLTLLLNYLQQK